MAWLRDGSKALLWAAGAFLVAFALLRSELFGGLSPLTLPLTLTPVAAYRWHHSRRLAALVAGWELVILVAAALSVAWAFRDFKFRAIQG